MSEDPFFSIIIPAYNRAPTIGRAIRSCLRQSFADFEVIVVDDGSRDGTAEAVARCGDSRVSCVRQENRGASAARNRGVAEARGTFVAFLDSDDEFLDCKLAIFHAAIVQAGPEATRTVWYSPLIFDRGQNNRMVKPERAIASGEQVGDYLFAYDGMMQTSTLVIGRDLFLQVGFDESLRNLEDLDLCLRLESEAVAIRMLTPPLVVWWPVGDAVAWPGGTGSTRVPTGVVCPSLCRPQVISAAAAVSVASPIPSSVTMIVWPPRVAATQKVRPASVV